ncbi:hypothetical protein EJB05_43690, partial [Eragrostis curvula]
MEVDGRGGWRRSGGVRIRNPDKRNSFPERVRALRNARVSSTNLMQCLKIIVGNLSLLSNVILRKMLSLFAKV